MANEAHLALLKQGVEAWNQWRQEHREILPDLSEARLSEVNLRGAILKRSNLSGALLHATHLVETDLRGANLSRANLSEAELIEANLREANLSGANLVVADLSGADLSRAKLVRANFWQTIMQATILVDVDLSQARELETVHHWGPSFIGIETIYRSQGHIPEVFLRGAGVPENFIEYMRSLTGKAFEYYSCFISYSSKDQVFAERLYADLQSKGVRCWYAPEDMKIGAKIRPTLDESIRLHDKLLLVLSRASVASQWVEQEVEKALERERKEKRLVLFPVRLDGAVIKIEDGWPALIRNTRHISDFSRWKEHDTYQKAFTRLLRDLQAESGDADGSNRA